MAKVNRRQNGEIKKEVYRRLATYQYLPDEKIAEHDDFIRKDLKNNNSSELYSFEAILQRQMRQKPPTQQKIDAWLEKDPKGYISTPHLTYDKGWVFLDHIERPIIGKNGKQEKIDSPYPYPANHRYLYINNDPLIEQDTFECVVHKYGARKDRQLVRKTVYRLKPGHETLRALYAIFGRYDPQIVCSSFWAENANLERERATELSQYIARCAEFLEIYGFLPGNLPAHPPVLSQPSKPLALKLLKMLQKDLENAPESPKKGKKGLLSKEIKPLPRCILSDKSPHYFHNILPSESGFALKTPFPAEVEE